MKRRNFFKTALIGTGAIALAPALALGQDPLASIRQYYYNWYIAPRDYNVHKPSINYWQLLSECVKPEPIKAWEGFMEITGSQHPYPTDRRTYTVNFRDHANVYQYRNGRNHIFWMNVEDYVFYQELERDAVLNFNQTHLLGVGLIPGLIHPFEPRLLRTRNTGIVSPLNYGGDYHLDGYEIHVIYQKY